MCAESRLVMCLLDRKKVITREGESEYVWHITEQT
jgi:hypothetical protein